ncbi:MerR family transcriptional regulator [Streptomyces sp. NPDC026672]|uniref:MerR family transcriptional regulator n=1 Tax=unclassified Streptomyces TaxID=2593676 RepID=UPI003401DB7B
MLTIGAFAKAGRLSPKALRLYDELDLLRPARVDPDTGYRYYAVSQLERARLVAWLRRLGMPLARIREVCALPAREAAREIRAYWARVEAETAARRDLATFLVAHLTDDVRKDTAMLELRHSARSDAGRTRPTNQDTAYAGPRLLAVADGYGPTGAPASSAAVEALKHLETTELSGAAVLNLLEAATDAASEAAREAASDEEAGTTLTALLWTGSRLALTHIGDSRAYLLRGGGRDPVGLLTGAGPTAPRGARGTARPAAADPRPETNRHPRTSLCTPPGHGRGAGDRPHDRQNHQLRPPVRPKGRGELCGRPRWTRGPERAGARSPRWVPLAHRLGAVVFGGPLG